MMQYDVIFYIAFHPDHVLFQFNLQPPFLQEGCDVFTFESTSNAQTFVDLLMTQLLGHFLRVPEQEVPYEDHVHILTNELISFPSIFHAITKYMACRSTNGLSNLITCLP